MRSERIFLAFLLAAHIPGLLPALGSMEPLQLMSVEPTTLKAFYTQPEHTNGLTRRSLFHVYLTRTNVSLQPTLMGYQDVIAFDHADAQYIYFRYVSSEASWVLKPGQWVVPTGQDIPEIDSKRFAPKNDLFLQKTWDLWTMIQLGMGRLKLNAAVSGDFRYHLGPLVFGAALGYGYATTWSPPLEGFHFEPLVGIGLSTKQTLLTDIYLAGTFSLLNFNALGLNGVFGTVWGHGLVVELRLGTATTGNYVSVGTFTLNVGFKIFGKN